VKHANANPSARVPLSPESPAPPDLPRRSAARLTPQQAPCFLTGALTPIKWARARAA